MFPTVRCLEPAAGLLAAASLPAVADQPGAADDDELMRRAGGGDGDAFALLFRRHERLARTLALRATRDLDAAEDIVQDVFTALWIDAPAWRPSGRFRAFLCVAVGRRSIDHLRRRRPASLDEVGADQIEAPDADDVLARLSREEDLALLSRAIEELPPRQRLAVLLAYGEGLPVKDCAAALELTPKAVESLLSRARAALRAAVQQHRGGRNP